MNTSKDVSVLTTRRTTNVEFTALEVASILLAHWQMQRGLDGASSIIGKSIAQNDEDFSITLTVISEKTSETVVPIMPMPRATAPARVADQKPIYWCCMVETQKEPTQILYVFARFNDEVGRAISKAVPDALRWSVSYTCEALPPGIRESSILDGLREDGSLA